MLILAYLGLLALVPLFAVKDSDFVRWHARNGLVLGLGGWVALSLLGFILANVPLLGCLASLVVGLCAVGLLVVDILGMVKALGGERWRIPWVSDLAEKVPL
jgi:fumarate reductase subunit D